MPFQRWLNSFPLAISCTGIAHSVMWTHLHAKALWRNTTYYSKDVSVGILVYCRDVVTTDASNTGWSTVWQHGEVRGQYAYTRGAKISLQTLCPAMPCPGRVVPSLQSGADDLGELWSSRGGSVCHIEINPLPFVIFPNRGVRFSCMLSHPSR